MADLTKQYEQDIISGKLSLEELNALKDKMDKGEWSVLRGLYNDIRFNTLMDIQKEILEKLDEVTHLVYNNQEKIAKLESNHLAHIEEDIISLQSALQASQGDLAEIKRLLTDG